MTYTWISNSSRVAVLFEQNAAAFAGRMHGLNNLIWPKRNAVALRSRKPREHYWLTRVVYLLNNKVWINFYNTLISVLKSDYWTALRKRFSTRFNPSSDFPKRIDEIWILKILHRKLRVPYSHLTIKHFTLPLFLVDYPARQVVWPQQRVQMIKNIDYHVTQLP